MVHVRGTTIQVGELVENGKDPFGKPVEERRWSKVDNVLIAPMREYKLLLKEDMNPLRGAYILAIPKGDKHRWRNAWVRFFGKTFQVIGDAEEGIEERMPLSWNKKVRVELLDGAFSDGKSRL